MRILHMIYRFIKGRTDEDIEQIRNNRYRIRRETLWYFLITFAMAIVGGFAHSYVLLGLTLFASNIIVLPTIILLIEKNDKDYIKMRERQREENRIKRAKHECYEILTKMYELAMNNNMLLDGTFMYLYKSCESLIGNANDEYSLSFVKSQLQAHLHDMIEDINRKQNHEHQEYRKQQSQNRNDDWHSHVNTSTDTEIEKSLRALGLDINIKDLAVIRKQYLKLIKTYHPDVCKDGGEKAKQVNEAYDILKHKLQ